MAHSIILSQLSRTEGFLVPSSLTLLLLSHQFDHVVNSQDGNGRLRGELETLDFGNGGFQDASFLVVTDDTFVEIQTNPVWDQRSNLVALKLITWLTKC